jgi:putative exosortase-associated protein (TIGR04073 family)
MCRKLGRGIVGVGFGALEIPIKVMEVNFEHGSLPAISWGVLEGVGWFVAREVVGVIDIATFYMPLPGCTFNKNIHGWGYGPIMEREWVITPETNAYGLVYTTNRTMEY